MSFAGAAATFSASQSDVDRALDALSHGPRARRRKWSGDGVTMGWVNDGKIWELNGSAVIWDGRLDNRQALINDLNAGELAPSDPELIWLAWRRWGDDFLNRVYGEFACALWDAEQNALVLGRDVVGTRALLYWTIDGTILFATEPRALWTDQRVNRGLNLNSLGPWLAATAAHGSDTLYEDISRVEPGQITVWSSGQIRSHRYWRPETLPPVRFETDEAYVEACRALIEAAVRRRIPASGQVASELSGGMDSTSVTAFAARILAESGRRLTAFTAAPRNPIDPKSRPGNIVDEFPLAASVAQRHPNIEHVRIDNDAIPIMTALQQTSASTDCPVSNVSNMPWGIGIEIEAHRRGCQTLLVGECGNMTLSYHGWLLLPYLLRRGRLLTLLRTWLEIQRGGDRRRWSSLASLTLGPLLPDSWVDLIRRWARKPREHLSDYSAIKPEAARAAGIDHTGAGHKEKRQGIDSRLRRVIAIQKFDQRAFFYAATARRYGIEVTDPLADRALIEFCLSIPDDQFLHAGEARSLARRMLKGVLPDSLLAERRKGLQAADWAWGLNQAMPEMREEIARLEKSPIAQKYLDLPRLKRLADDWPNKDWTDEKVFYDYLIAFNRGLGTGQFIRRMEGRND